MDNIIKAWNNLLINVNLQSIEEHMPLIMENFQTQPMREVENLPNLGETTIKKTYLDIVRVLNFHSNRKEATLCTSRLIVNPLTVVIKTKILENLNKKEYTVMLLHQRHHTPKLICKTSTEEVMIIPHMADWLLSLPFIQTVPMRILCWNARGAGSLNFRNIFKDLVKINSPSIIIVLETRISGDRIEKLSQ